MQLNVIVWQLRRRDVTMYYAAINFQRLGYRCIMAAITAESSVGIKDSYYPQH
jgi:hypothetical protein